MVESLQFPHVDSQYKRLTISIGVAVVVPTVTLESEALVQAADAALYQAKANGRNQVMAGAMSAEPGVEESPVS